MKEKIKTILLCASTAMLAVSLYSTFSLKNSFENRIGLMENNLSNDISTLESQINNISSDVRTSLEESTNIISSCDYNVKKIDTDKATASVEVVILPKEYTPQTKAEVFLSDTKYDAVFENGKFICNFEMPLFESKTITNISLLNGEKTENQQFDLSVSPSSGSMPYIYGDFSGSYNINKNKNDNTVYSLDGSINIDVNFDQENNMENKFDIYAVSGGKTLYSDTFELDSSETYYCHGYAQIKQDFETDKNSSLDFYAVLKDKYGFYYVYKIDSASFNGNNSSDSDTAEAVEVTNTVNIYNKDGKLVHEINNY